MAAHSDLATGPEGLLLQAANAARELLPRLEARMKELARETEQLNQQMVKLRHLASFAELAGADAGPGEDRPDSVQAVNDIDMVLLASPEPLKVAELRDTIKTTMNRNWAESTLYAHLRRGREAGTYLHEGNRWSLTEKGRENIV